MRLYGGQFYRHLPLPHPISLTRSGLPRKIPSFHRQMIKKRDAAKADSLVRLYLSFYSCSKPILVRKKMSFAFTSIVSPPASVVPIALLEELEAKCLSLAERYIPRAFDIPMNAGFRWFPQWSSSPIKQSLAGEKGKLWSPLLLIHYWTIPSITD